MNEILNQEEIDALMKGVNEGAVPLAGDVDLPVAGDVQPFDLARQGAGLTGLPALEMVNERLVRQLTADLGHMLRREVNVGAATLQRLRHADYAQSLPAPASLNLVRLNPLRGTALLVLDAPLVHALVDTFFGGNGRTAAASTREFTRTELRVVQMVLAKFHAALKSAWASLLPLEVEVLRSESNPAFAGIAAAAEQVLAMSYRIDVDGAGGVLQLALPYAALEPLRERLHGSGNEPPAPDPRWLQNLREEIEDAEVELVPVVGRASLTVGKLVDLQPGDVIPCDFDGQVTVYAEGVPLLRGTYGASRGLQAVKIATRLSTRRAV